MDTCSLISLSSGSAASSGLPLLCELTPRTRAAVLGGRASMLPVTWWALNLLSCGAEHWNEAQPLSGHPVTAGAQS